MKVKLLVTSGTAACLGIIAALLPVCVHAAKVNATLSWVTGDYGTPYDYSGPRLDMNLNPDGSNWYYDLGFRKQFHDSSSAINVLRRWSAIVSVLTKVGSTELSYS